MTLSEFSLNNRYTIFALTIAAVIFGTMAYVSLPIQLFPDTAPPLVNVLTAYPGAAAEDVADLVSEPIEEEVASLEGVYKVSSTSQEGLSLIAIEFRYDVLVDLAAVDVQNSITRIRGALPGEIAEPQVLKFSTSDRPVLTMGLSGKDLVAIRRLAEDVIAPEVQRVSGVALVDVFGGYEPEITVKVSRDRLEAHGISLGMIIEAIRTHNISVPAGQIRSGGQQYSFRIDSRRESIEEIAQIPLMASSGKQVHIGDLAEIEEGSGEDLSRFRVQGNPAIAVQVFKQDDANTVEVVELAREKFSAISARYPQLEIMVAEESASFTRQVVGNMLGSVWQALILATIVIFLFLGSVRRGVVVAISMPMSFLLTFAGMKLFGIQVDMVTLTAIILAIGMVVDASVVVLENITRHYQEEKLSPGEAARQGAVEIQFAVIAGNATTLTVLVPLLFLYGFVGKTFGPLAATLIIAFISSLLVALSLVPILTAMVTKDGGRMEKLALKISSPWNMLMEFIKRAYVKVLERSLRKRWIVYLLAAILFLSGLVILRFQGMELLPKMDGGTSFVTLETPSGSSLDETENVIRDVESLIKQEDAVKLIYSQMGFETGMHSFAGGGVQGPTQGYISITLSPRTEREETIWEIQERLREYLAKTPNIKNFVVRESGSTAKATTASSIVVSIKGDDPLVLDKLGDQVLSEVAKVEGIVNPYRSWHVDQRIIAINVDEERAGEMGISPQRAAQELVWALDGVNAGMLRGEMGEDSPIRVIYDESFRDRKEDAFAVRINSMAESRMVPMNSIASGREHYAQGLVTRENLQPSLEILALHQDRPLNFVTADVLRAVSRIEVPQGYAVSLAGEEADMKESRAELVGALLLALIAIYLLLVAQFRSFVHPITVLMSVPLSLIGVSIALWVSGKAVSMPVLVGLILLIGIVVNNAIILIDFIRQLRSEGKERRDAIVESVRVRFRPIMMTSLSTVAGMIPLAMEWALGAERFSPLAIAVIGGMTASTFLTMIFIPVMYDTFDELGSRLKNLKGIGR